MPRDTPRNRLGLETSPYLRQHADNPVDWYPWGDEAQARARAEDRPILLSIGYSACHWCHVMERESFADPGVAQLMNAGFVNVKVDREERPDVDAVYMRAVQALSGRGGWPLTVFLTPRGEPFFGGTYFPPEPRHGMPSFRQVLEATQTAWEERREDVLRAADQIRGALARANLGHGGPEAERKQLGPELLSRSTRVLLRQLDPVHGGFGGAPKFPQAPVLGFLLERYVFTGDESALEGALLTLRRMADGGIRDQLGGGFHRYSVDARWLAPHFEKMLYDNALLAEVYLRAFQLTGDPRFEHVCRETLDDVLDDFRSEEGAFFTARDADSEGVEGRFYLWDAKEIEDLLPADEATLFCRAYDVSASGNFEGRNILHLPHDLDAVAREEGLSRVQLDEVLDQCRLVLKRHRNSRVPPARDEKILASGNGLTIRALAEAGAALGEARYVEAAGRAAEYLISVLRPSDSLLHQVTLGEAKIPGFLDDVAGLGNASLSLHEATLRPVWLEVALELDREVHRRFGDAGDGLLYDTPIDGERLLIRPREMTDGPTPSGNALAAELSLRLGWLLGDDERLSVAARIATNEATTMESLPTAFGRLLAIAGRLGEAPIQVALISSGILPQSNRLLREAHRQFLPNRVITGSDPKDPPAALRLLEGRTASEGRPTAYVCRDFACEVPATEPEQLAAQMHAIASALHIRASFRDS